MIATLVLIGVCLFRGAAEFVAHGAVSISATGGLALGALSLLVLEAQGKRT